MELLNNIDFDTTKIYVYFIDKINKVNNNLDESIIFKKKEFQNIKKEKINDYTKKYYYNLIKQTNLEDNHDLVFTESYEELFRNDKIIIYSYKTKNHDIKCFPNLYKYDHEDNVSDMIYKFDKYDNIRLINKINKINNNNISEITIIEILNNKNIKEFYDVYLMS